MGTAASTVSTGAQARYQKRERLFKGTSVVLSLLLLWRFLLPSTASDTSVTRVEVGLPPGQELTGFLDISPDGKRLAYTSKDEVGPSQLYLRSLDAFEPRLVDGTAGAFAPFFSPDGEWVGFFANRKLLRVGLPAASPSRLLMLRSQWGGSWGEDGSIIFTPATGAGPARVSSAGGPVESLTAADKAEGGYGHAWPQWLPDGRHVLFSIWRAEEKLRYEAAVLSLDTGTWSVVLEEHASGARYVESGHLLYTYSPGSDLFSIPFDLDELEVYGAPVPILEVYYRNGHSPFAVSQTGTLAFNPEDPAKRILVWVDRDGRETPLVTEQGQYDYPRISPDGSRVVFEDARQLWVMDLDRGTRTRMTSKAFNSYPVWTPDGESIIFSSNRATTWNIYSKSIRGTDAPEPVAQGEYSLVPHSMSFHGNMAASGENPGTGLDIWTVQLGEEPHPFVVSPFSETQPQISPDGRFLAYVSDDSGRSQVYVQPYPPTGDRWPISTERGTEPLWSPDGTELFYRHGNTVLAVDIGAASSFEPGIPRTLFDGNYLFPATSSDAREYDISRDGKRFLMVRRESSSIPTHINVVLNWLDELERLVPTKN